MEGRGEGEGGTGRRRRRRVKAVQGVEEHTRIGTHKAYGRSEGQFWVGVVIILMCGLVDETPCANWARYPPPLPSRTPTRPARQLPALPRHASERVVAVQRAAIQSGHRQCHRQVPENEREIQLGSLKWDNEWGGAGSPVRTLQNQQATAQA